MKKEGFVYRLHTLQDNLGNTLKVCNRHNKFLDRKNKEKVQNNK